MRIKPGFRLRTVMGKPIVVAEGLDQINFNKLISLNESAALLWQKVEQCEFTPASLAEILVENYDIDPAVALADATEIANEWIKVGVAE